MTIRFLDPTLINQIAAGEVIERPASAIKELVENAIDAGATKIDVHIKDGGRTYMSVTDNGCGMSADDLQLAVERHATSKIPDSDLFNIRTLGFRGEALPSIGAVSRLTLISRRSIDDTAWQLSVEGGQKSPPQPISGILGTRVEIRDLFYATPARLKFLKSASTELSHISDILQRLALINDSIHFTLSDGDRTVFSYSEASKRFSDILGKEFQENACDVSCHRDDLYLTGAISIPTFNRSNSADQYLFVNGRPVKDKLLATIVRLAYQDYLAPHRYPVLALFLTLPPEDVDINVHPAKAEVRFRDVTVVRNFMINALKQTLSQASDRTATTLSESAIAKFQPDSAYLTPKQSGIVFPVQRQYTPSVSRFSSMAPRLPLEPKPLLVPEFAENTHAFSHQQPVQGESFAPAHYRLGVVKAQIDDTYIVSETSDGLIITDQHAAHERLVYESLKKQLETTGVKRQALLIPEVLVLSEKDLNLLKKHQNDFSAYGLTLDFFGNSQVVVREVPALLGQANLKELFQDLIAEITEHGDHLCLKENLNEILATYACHHSVRSGRKLSIEEMDALLRQMESTPYSGQCNHGRPTYIELKKTDIEKLFGRS